jgi:murein DD-endopeptidase MepM/ murein hydrolase activator NlpD
MMPRVRVVRASGLAAATAASVLTATLPAGAAQLPGDTSAAGVSTDTVQATTVAPVRVITRTASAAAAAKPTAAAATLVVAPRPRSGCPAVGAVGVAFPNRPTLVLAPVRRLSTARLAYPADGSVVSAAGLNLDISCAGVRPASGTAEVHALSLFDGAVTAGSVTIGLAGAPTKVVGLRVAGRPASLTVGTRIRLGKWGYLLAPDPGAVTSAFQIELVENHAGLPAGTVLLVPYAGIRLAPSAGPSLPAPELLPKPKARPNPLRPAPRALHRPLTVTPRLRAGPYVFPVAGTPIFGDTYGGPRSDVPGGWHHGDDIFAPLGTPVVAVANGSINRVGWQRLGGWRLWVRDRAGDEFYYAHLSGYSPLALRHGRVHAGDVIGFVGNTGDAFTTIPHLHFEVHPRRLLHLQYDGAVNPTTYLDAWQHPGPLYAPRPVLPRLPRATAPRSEARQNFRELLAARGLQRIVKKVARLPQVRLVATEPIAVVPFAVPAPPRRITPFEWSGIDAALAAAVLGLVMWRRSRRALQAGRLSG